MQNLEDERQNDKVKTQFSDPIEFINKTYNSFQLLDLQEALKLFAKSSSETKAKIDKIIPKNFAKFVNCKELMDKLRKDYTEKNLTHINSDRSVTILSEIFDHLIKKYDIDIENKAEKEHFLLFPVREFKEILRSNILNFEVFISTLKNERKSMNGYDPQLKREILEEIAPELKDFLQAIYDQMINPKIDFEENCRLMEMYLYVSNFEDNYNDEQKRTKLINTMLVNFKEETFNKLAMSDEYYSQVFRLLMKILEHADVTQGVEAINHVFFCFLIILKKGNAKYSKLLFRRIEDFRKTFKGKQYCIREIKTNLSDLKLDIFKYFVTRADIKEAVEIFDIMIGVLKEQEPRKAQEIIAKKVEDHLLQSNLLSFEYIAEQDKCMQMIINCFGYSESKILKTLERKLRERNNEEITRVAKGFTELFYKKEEDVKILMEATRIVEQSHGDNFRIFFECKEYIMTRPVVLYYLHSFLKMESQSLTEDEKQTVEELSFQFEHLLEE